MDVLITLQKLFEAIREKNDQKVDELIYRLNVPDMKPKTAKSMLRKILTLCTDVDYGTRMDMFMERFNNPNGSLSILAEIFQDQAYDDQVLRYVVMNYVDATYPEIMLEYIDYDRDFNLILIYKRILDIFGEQPLDILLTLMKSANEQDNQMVVGFLKEIVGKQSNPAEKPEYVDNFTGSKELPYDDEIALPTFQFETQLPSEEEIINILLEGIKDSGLTEEKFDQAREDVTEHVSMASSEERRKMVNPILENKALLGLSDNITLFRILGPSNAILGEDLRSGSPCSKYGGCRMLTCNCFNNLDPDYDTPIDNPEWFVGYCEKCSQKIAKKCYALRIPVVHGGWQGCFCSKRCLLENEDYFDIDAGEPNVLTVNMVDIVHNQLRDIGIQDRKYKNY